MDPSRELHRVPAPWDPSRELHRVPAHGYLGGPHSWKAEFSLGPHSAFRRIAPNGNSTDGRQTFFQPARFADVCIMLAPMDPRLCARVPARSSNHARTPWNRLRELHRVPAHGSKVVHHAGPVGVDHSMELQPGPLGSMVVHRVPARSSNHARPPWVDRGN
jgi:hypothetical protein